MIRTNQSQRNLRAPGQDRDQKASRFPRAETPPKNTTPRTVSRAETPTHPGGRRISALKNKGPARFPGPKAPQANSAPKKQNPARFPGRGLSDSLLSTADQRAKSSRAPLGFLRVIVRFLVGWNMIRTLPYAGRQVKRDYRLFPSPGVIRITL